MTTLICHPSDLSLPLDVAAAAVGRLGTSFSAPNLPEEHGAKPTLLLLFPFANCQLVVVPTPHLMTVCQTLSVEASASNGQGAVEMGGHHFPAWTTSQRTSSQRSSSNFLAEKKGSLTKISMCMKPLKLYQIILSKIKHCNDRNVLITQQISEALRTKIAQALLTP
jgi:hypothetical protein